MPPAWLAGFEVNGLTGKELCYLQELSMLRNIVEIQEREQYHHLKDEPGIPLSSFWSTMDHDAFFIAHALLRLNTLGDILGFP